MDTCIKVSRYPGILDSMHQCIETRRHAEDTQQGIWASGFQGIKAYGLECIEASRYPCILVRMYQCILD